MFIVVVVAVHSPDEVLAVAAEGGVLEEPRDELVVLDLADVLLLERALPDPGPELRPAGAASVAAAAAAVGVARRSGRRRRCGLDQRHLGGTEGSATVLRSSLPSLSPLLFPLREASTE